MNCTTVENEFADNIYQRSELDYLIFNDPLVYADLVLDGEPEAYLKAVTEYKPLDYEVPILSRNLTERKIEILS